MTPEVKDLLERNTELLEQNNKILKKLQRYQVWGFWLTMLWYVLLILSPLALYFYVFEPYLTALNDSYENIFDSLEHVPGIGSFFDR